MTDINNLMAAIDEFIAGMCVTCTTARVSQDDAARIGSRRYREAIAHYHATVQACPVDGPRSLELHATIRDYYQQFAR